MRPGALVVRAVEYEVLPRTWPCVGLDPAEAKAHFRDQTDLAVVKCVSIGRTGEKLTCIADAPRFMEHLDTGGTTNPSGILAASTWPVVFRGWPQAS